MRPAPAPASATAPAPDRHNMLFELIRQDNLARAARDRFEPAELDLNWENAFTVKALASLRAA